VHELDAERRLGGMGGADGGEQRNYGGGERSLHGAGLGISRVDDDPVRVPAGHCSRVTAPHSNGASHGWRRHRKRHVTEIFPVYLRRSARNGP
jgi:hypothetical protein